MDSAVGLGLDRGRSTPFPTMSTQQTPASPFETAFNETLRLLGECEYEAALARVNALLAEAPKEARLYDLRSIAQGGLGQLKESAESVRQCVAVGQDARYLSNLIFALRRSEEWAKAATLCQRLAQGDNSPRIQAELRSAIGDYQAAAGNLPEALAQYDAATKLLPGYGYPFHRRLLAHAKRSWRTTPGAPLPSPVPKATLTVEHFAASGRFGDVLTHYAMLLYMAKAAGLTPALPDWWGDYFFARRMTARLTTAPVVRRPPLAVVPKLLEGTYTGRFPSASVDLASLMGEGITAFHQAMLASPALLREALAPARPIQERAEKAVSLVRSRGKTLVAVHLRRGDFRDIPQRFSPEGWYVEWLRALWPTLEAPVLFVASDEPEAVLPAFREWAPVTSRDLPPSLPRLEFYHDFAVLTQADVLGLSQSVFSNLARILNPHVRAVFRPDMQGQRVVESW